MFSTRQYTVPDPPGLFDGHVWPMYLKHRREMENSGITIGTWRIYILLECYVCDFGFMMYSSAVSLTFFVHFTDYLDGLKTKEDIYNQVYEDIQNNLLNRL